MANRHCSDGSTLIVQVHCCFRDAKLHAAIHNRRLLVHSHSGHVLFGQMHRKCRCGTSSTSRPCLSRSSQKLAACGPLLTQPAANVRLSLCQRLLCTDVDFLWSQFIDTVATPKGTNETLSLTPASGSPTSSPTEQTLPPAQGSSTGVAPSIMSPRPRRTHLKCICRRERDRCTACPMVHRTMNSSKSAIMRADTLPLPAWVPGKARMKLLIIFRFMDACCNELVPGGALVPHGIRWPSDAAHTRCFGANRRADRSAGRRYAPCRDTDAGLHERPQHGWRGAGRQRLQHRVRCAPSEPHMTRIVTVIASSDSSTAAQS